MEVKGQPVDNALVASDPLIPNGQCLGGVEIPMELLETFLGFLPLDSLVEMTEVCHLWQDIIRNPVFWKKHYKRKGRSSELWTRVHNHIHGRPDEWAVHFAVAKHDVFNRNLLLNPFGTQGFEEWRIVSGDLRDFDEDDTETMGWCVVDNPGLRIRNFPQGIGPSTCFATDAFSCSKEQKIDLWALGFTPAVMRACIPFTIKWSSYVGCPEGHGGFYEMFIRLQDSKFEDLNLLSLSSPSVTINQSIVILPGSPFDVCGGSHKVQGRDAHEVINKQLRYIYFYHGGMAGDNLSGYNGPHIYNPSVSIQLPSSD